MLYLLPTFKASSLVNIVEETKYEYSFLDNYGFFFLGVFQIILLILHIWYYNKNKPDEITKGVLSPQSKERIIIFLDIINVLIFTVYIFTKKVFTLSSSSVLYYIFNIRSLFIISLLITACAVGMHTANELSNELSHTKHRKTKVILLVMFTSLSFVISIMMLELLDCPPKIFISIPQSQVVNDSQVVSQKESVGTSTKAIDVDFEMPDNTTFKTDHIMDLSPNELISFNQKLKQMTEGILELQDFIETFPGQTEELQENLGQGNVNINNLDSIDDNVFEAVYSMSKETYLNKFFVYINYFSQENTAITNPESIITPLNHEQFQKVFDNQFYFEPSFLSEQYILIDDEPHICDEIYFGYFSYVYKSIALGDYGDVYLNFNYFIHEFLYDHLSGFLKITQPHGYKNLKDMSSPIKKTQLRKNSVFFNAQSKLQNKSMHFMTIPKDSTLSGTQLITNNAVLKYIDSNNEYDFDIYLHENQKTEEFPTSLFLVSKQNPSKTFVYTYSKTGENLYTQMILDVERGTFFVINAEDNRHSFVEFKSNIVKYMHNNEKIDCFYGDPHGSSFCHKTTDNINYFKTDENKLSAFQLNHFVTLRDQDNRVFQNYLFNVLNFKDGDLDNPDTIPFPVKITIDINTGKKSLDITGYTDTNISITPEFIDSNPDVYLTKTLKTKKEILDIAETNIDFAYFQKYTENNNTYLRVGSSINKTLAVLKNPSVEAEVKIQHFSAIDPYLIPYYMIIDNTGCEINYQETSLKCQANFTVFKESDLLFNTIPSGEYYVTIYDQLNASIKTIFFGPFDTLEAMTARNLESFALHENNSLVHEKNTGDIWIGLGEAGRDALEVKPLQWNNRPDFYFDEDLGTQLAKIVIPEYQELSSTEAQFSQMFNFFVHSDDFNNFYVNMMKYMNTEGHGGLLTYEVDITTYSATNPIGELTILEDSLENMSGSPNAKYLRVKADLNLITEGETQKLQFVDWSNNTFDMPETSISKLSTIETTNNEILRVDMFEKYMFLYNETTLKLLGFHSSFKEIEKSEQDLVSIFSNDFVPFLYYSGSDLNLCLYSFNTMVVSKTYTQPNAQTETDLTNFVSGINDNPGNLSYNFLGEDHLIFSDGIEVAFCRADPLLAEDGSVLSTDYRTLSNFGTVNRIKTNNDRLFASNKKILLMGEGSESSLLFDGSYNYFTFENLSDLSFVVTSGYLTWNPTTGVSIDLGDLLCYDPVTETDTIYIRTAYLDSAKQHLVGQLTNSAFWYFDFTSNKLYHFHLNNGELFVSDETADKLVITMNNLTLDSAAETEVTKSISLEMLQQMITINFWKQTTNCTFIKFDMNYYTSYTGSRNLESYFFTSEDSTNNKDGYVYIPSIEPTIKYMMFDANYERYFMPYYYNAAPDDVNIVFFSAKAGESSDLRLVHCTKTNNTPPDPGEFLLYMSGDSPFRIEAITPDSAIINYDFINAPIDVNATPS